MEIQVRQKVKSIMWQSVGEVRLINREDQKVYVEFNDSSRHNGWYPINELVVLTGASNAF